MSKIMDWFSGTIPEAIELAQKRRSIFVVYVTGDDSASKEIEDFWGDMMDICRRALVVAIKIHVGSEACRRFSQIYPVVVVPASYFIGSDGVPVEVIGGSVSKDVFLQKALSVLEKNKPTGAPSPPHSPPASVRELALSDSEPCDCRRDTLKAAEGCGQATLEDGLAAGGEESAISVQGAAAMSVTEAEGKGNEEPDAMETRVDLAERVERATVLIEQRQNKRALDDFQEVHRREVDKRRLGREAGKLHQQQQQQRDAVDISDRIRKEREDDRRARQRVKEQIEQDRLERDIRYRKEKRRDLGLQALSNTRQMEQQRVEQEAESHKKVASGVRIQFRLPDGSSLTGHFAPTDTLQSVHDFVLRTMGAAAAGARRLTLSTYPRRTLTVDDMPCDLLQLQLVPSAVIFVVPQGEGVVSRDSFRLVGVRLTQLLSALVAPLNVLWNYVISFLWTPGERRRADGGADNSGREYSSGAAYSGTRSTTRVRQSGNVRRLVDVDNGDDDDTATWNGNSTQQL